VRFRILLLSSTGKKRTVEFSTEDEAIEFLKASYCTEAPLSFEYADGSPVEAKVIERIYSAVFKGREER
jgi:hypothetical protein